MIKNPPASAEDVRDTGSIPGSVRSLGGGHGNLLQYSCLENPTDRGARQAVVHGVVKRWTRLKCLSMHNNREAACFAFLVGSCLALVWGDAAGLIR